MATGGQPLSRTLNAGSDDCPIRIMCVPCQRRNNSKNEAQHYCVQCDETLCKTCLEFHGSFQKSKDHKVLDGPFEECSHHSGKPFTIFCKRHDSVACPVCVTDYHSLCAGQRFLACVAADVRKGEEYCDIDQNIERIKTNIQILKRSRNDSKTSLIQSKRSTLEQISNFRKRVNTIFDDLETSARTEAKQIYNDGTKKADEDMRKCNSILVDMQQLQQRLHAIDPNKEQHIFIEMKKTQYPLADIDKLLYEMSRRRIRKKYKLILDPKIEQYLTNIKSFGDISTVTAAIPAFENNSSIVSINKLIKENLMYIFK